MSRYLLLFALVITSFTSPAQTNSNNAQPLLKAKKKITALKAQNNIIIDGKLTETEWQSAQTAD